MQVRILTYHMESLELKNTLSEIGAIVHSINTIAVSLSLMPNEGVSVPESLNISWKPSNIELSKKRARTLAYKSIYVYVAESLFEYLNSISKNPLWRHKNINFQGQEKKADRVYSFLTSIPDIDVNIAILVELLCHWRNRIIHNSSSADLSHQKKSNLLMVKNDIYALYHHFDTECALNNFKNNIVTLKDVSTLSTMVIKCCRIVDEYFFLGIAKLSNTEIFDLIKGYPEFTKIIKYQKTLKRERQVRRWLEIHFPYLGPDRIDNIATIANH